MVLVVVTAVAVDEEGGVVYWSGVGGIINQTTLDGNYSTEVVDTRKFNLKSKIIIITIIP